MITVYENVFDNSWIASLSSNLVKQGWFADNIANRKTWPYKESGSHRLLGATFFYRHNENNITYNTNKELSLSLVDAFFHIQKVVKKNIFLKEISANLQFKGMDGTPHIDGGPDDYAYILLLCNEKLPKNIGGEFIHLPSKRKVPFESGKLIEINAVDKHHALSFNKPHYARMSIKWMGQKI